MTVMFGLRVAATVTRCCVDGDGLGLDVVRRIGRSVVGEGRRVVVVRWIGRFEVVDMGFLLVVVLVDDVTVGRLL